MLRAVMSLSARSWPPHRFSHHTIHQIGLIKDWEYPHSSLQDALLFIWWSHSSIMYCMWILQFAGCLQDYWTVSGEAKGREKNKLVHLFWFSLDFKVLPLWWTVELLYNMEKIRLIVRKGKRPDWKSMIGVTIAFILWGTISYIVESALRRLLQREALDAAESAGALSEVAGWIRIIRPLSDWIPSYSLLLLRDDHGTLPWVSQHARDWLPPLIQGRWTSQPILSAKTPAGNPDNVSWCWK